MDAVDHAWLRMDRPANLMVITGVFIFGEPVDFAALTRVIETRFLRSPLLMTRALLPGMIDRGHGRIVNVGSMFGSIGFPCFAAYSATKFALWGYSQALRRELAGTGVGVNYVSPRAVKTAFNPPVVHEMAAQGIMRMDEPDRVARAIVQAIEKGRKDVYVGFPESLFARINAVLPEPALLRRRSGRPKAERVFSTSADTDSGSRTSVGTAKARSASLPAAATVASSFSGVRPAETTL